MNYFGLNDYKIGPQPLVTLFTLLHSLLLLLA